MLRLCWPHLARRSSPWKHTWRRVLLLEPLESRDLPSFVTAPAYPAGANARAVAVADFNGDGQPDLAVANYTGNGTVSVLLASGGGYSAPVGYAAGVNPIDVIAADFNGDGKQDLAVVDNLTANNLQVLKGNGDGTFQAAVSYTVGLYPRAVVAGDFDADGDLDLATASYVYPGTNGTVTILRNAGDGTFTSAGGVYVGTQPHDLAVGDFDGDGDLDLVAAGYWLSGYSIHEPLVKVLLGQGDGTFTAGPTYTDWAPGAVAAGDFDADGDLDLAVGNNGANGYLSTTVSVWLGQGDGTFSFA